MDRVKKVGHLCLYPYDSRSRCKPGLDKTVLEPLANTNSLKECLNVISASWFCSDRRCNLISLIIKLLCEISNNLTTGNITRHRYRVLKVVLRFALCLIKPAFWYSLFGSFERLYYNCLNIVTSSLRSETSQGVCLT